MTIQNIPFKDLKVSKSNVRVSKTIIDSLAANIGCIGLLQNLVAIPNCEANKFEVIGGKRRLKAIGVLVGSNDHPDWTEETPIPCKIQDGSATMASLSENFERERLHPVDEFKGFRKLETEGFTPEQIARDFGISVREVRQRLALGVVHQAILTAFKAGELTLEEVKAFTLAKTKDAQIAVYHELPTWQIGQRTRFIKNHFTDESTSANCPVAAFVGQEAYQEAGGTVSTDLFSDDRHTFFDDTALLHRLALEKLEAEGAAVIEDGFKWVETGIEEDYEFIRAHMEEGPERRTLNKKQEKALEKIKGRLKALHEQDQLDDDEYRETIQLQAEIHSLEYAYTEEQKARLGVYLTINRAGTIDRTEGLLRPEDAPEDATKEETKEQAPEPVNPAEKPLSAKLRCDLRAARNQIVKLHIAKNPDIAFDLLLHSLLSRRYGGGGIIAVSVSHQQTKSSTEDLEQSKAGLEMKALKAALPTDFANLEAIDQFKAVQALSKKDKAKWLAVLVADGLYGQLPDDQYPENTTGVQPIYEHIGIELGIQVSDYFRPNCNNYFDRITKAQLLKVASETVGPEWSQSRMSSPKSEVSAAMDERFDPSVKTPGATKEENARVAAWVPEPMRFDR